MRHFVVHKARHGAWYGCERKGCPYPVAELTRREKKQAHEKGVYSERECEVDCFLTVLSETPDHTFTLLDLGAGWGEWGMALAGVIDNGVVPLRFKNYWSLSVECDPAHRANLEKNLRWVHGWAVLGAVGDKDGETRINTGAISDDYCGSSLSFAGYFSGSRLAAVASGLYHSLRKKTVTVPMFKIDTLMSTHGLNHVDLVTMDVQGAELLALDGARETIQSKAVGWWLIGTHGGNVHEKVKDKLESHCDLLADAPPGKVTRLADDYSVWCQKGQDGIQLWRAKR